MVMNVILKKTQSFLNSMYTLCKPGLMHFKIGGMGRNRGFTFKGKTGNNFTSSIHPWGVRFKISQGLQRCYTARGCWRDVCISALLLDIATFSHFQCRPPLGLCWPPVASDNFPPRSISKSFLALGKFSSVIPNALSCSFLGLVWSREICTKVTTFIFSL